MKIRFRLVAGICALMVGGSAVVVLFKTKEPIKTTVCELVAHPERFNGKLVQVRATMNVGFEITAFVDNDCERGGLDGWSDSESQGSWLFAYINSEDDLQHPERLKWKRLRAFKNMSTGKITTWRGGFGHMNISSNQLVWQSVSDVVAVPIERSFYDKRQ